MAAQTTYTYALANFASLCNQVAETGDVVLINRQNAEDVALIAASELSGLLETAHLLRSPRNANRLLTVLNRAFENTESPQNIDELKKELDFEKVK